MSLFRSVVATRTTVTVVHTDKLMSLAKRSASLIGCQYSAVVDYNYACQEFLKPFPRVDYRRNRWCRYCGVYVDNGQIKTKTIEESIRPGDIS